MQGKELTHLKKTVGYFEDFLEREVMYKYNSYLTEKQKSSQSSYFRSLFRSQSRSLQNPYEELRKNIAKKMVELVDSKEITTEQKKELINKFLELPEEIRVTIDGLKTGEDWYSPLAVALKNHDRGMIKFIVEEKKESLDKKIPYGIKLSMVDTNEISKTKKYNGASYPFTFLDLAILALSKKENMDADEVEDLKKYWEKLIAAKGIDLISNEMLTHLSHEEEKLNINFFNFLLPKLKNHQAEFSSLGLWKSYYPDVQKQIFYSLPDKKFVWLRIFLPELDGKTIEPQNQTKLKTVEEINCDQMQNGAPWKISKEFEITAFDFLEDYLTKENCPALTLTLADFYDRKGNQEKALRFYTLFLEKITATSFDKETQRKLLSCIGAQKCKWLKEKLENNGDISKETKNFITQDMPTLTQDIAKETPMSSVLYAVCNCPVPDVKESMRNAEDALSNNHSKGLKFFTEKKSIEADILYFILFKKLVETPHHSAAFATVGYALFDDKGSQNVLAYLKHLVKEKFNFLNDNEAKSHFLKQLRDDYSQSKGIIDSIHKISEAKASVDSISSISNALQNLEVAKENTATPRNI